MFHARYATHGVKNEENCHPFKVPSKHDTYLAHNGILDIDIKAGDRRSDTRIFAEDTLPAMGGVTALDDDHVWTMVSKWSLGSKIVVLHLDPSASDQCYISTSPLAIGIMKECGGLITDTSHQVHNLTLLHLVRRCREDTDKEYYDAECQTCGAIAFEDGNPYYCEMCYTCFDCKGSYHDTCLCYTPERDRLAYTSLGERDWWNDSKSYNGWGK
jgi:hypothetical protein